MAMEVFKLVGRITYEGQKKVEAGLDRLGTKIKSAERKLADFGEKAQAVGQKTSEIGETLSTKVTLPLAAFGALGVKSASDMQAAMGLLAAQTDRTAEDTKALQDAARDLWRNAYGQDVNEAAEAVALVDRNMGNLVSSNQEVKDLAEYAFILKDAFGYEIQESTRAASNLMQNFGLTGEEAFDMITTAAQRGGDYSDELIDSINEYSTQFANMGFTGAEMMGMFTSAAENGIFSLDKLADSVKESFLQITDGGENTKKAIQELGLNYDQVTGDINAGGEKANAAFGVIMTAISKVTDEADRNRLAVELMGTPLEDLGPQYQAFFADTERELKNFTGSTEQAGKDLYDNFGVRLTGMFRQFQDAMLPLANTLITVIEPAFNALISGVEKLANWFGSLTASQQQWIVILGIAAAAIGPLLVVVGMLISSVASIVSAIAAVGLVTAGWIAGIALLVAGLAIAYAKFEWFRNGVNSVFQFISSFIKPIIADFTAFFKQKISEIKLWWDQNGAMIQQAFQNVFNVIMTVVKVAVAILMPIVQGFISGIKNIISGGLNIIMGLVTFFAALFTGNWKKLWTSLKQILSGAIQLIWGLFQAGFLGRIFGVIRGFVSKTASTISGWVGKVISFFRGFASRAKSTFTGAMDSISLKVMYGMDKVKNGLMKPVSAARKFIGEQIDKIKGFFSGLKLKLPKIKLPHFSLKGSFSLKPPRVPKLGVSWYKKGAVFDGPSIIGVGEEPGVEEAVIPLKKSVLASIGEGIAAAGGAGGNNGQAVQVVSPIYIGGRLLDTVIREIAPGMNEQLKKIERRTGKSSGRSLRGQ
jgi:TP901 family phage tail tape measure protein